MSLKTLLAGGVVVAVLFVLALSLSPLASASHIDLEARRAEREAAREARRAEREARRAEREQGESEEPSCMCSTRLSFGAPSLFMSGGVLKFIPTVDVSIRSSGEDDAPPFTVALSYEGQSQYTSDDIVPPPGVSFGATKTIVDNAYCGSRYSFTGLQLAPVTLTGLTSTLLGPGEELDGTIRMAARIEGCGFDDEEKQMSFEMGEFGNVQARSWRSVR